MNFSIYCASLTKILDLYECACRLTVVLAYPLPSTFPLLLNTQVYIRTLVTNYTGMFCMLFFFHHDCEQPTDRIYKHTGFRYPHRIGLLQVRTGFDVVLCARYVFVLYAFTFITFHPYVSAFASP